MKWNEEYNTHVATSWNKYTPMIRSNDGNKNKKRKQQKWLATVFNVNDIKRLSFIFCFILFSFFYFPFGFSLLLLYILFGKIETHGCNVPWIFKWFSHQHTTTKICAYGTAGEMLARWRWYAVAVPFIWRCDIQNETMLFQMNDTYNVLWV